MVDQRLQISELHFDTFPTPSNVFMVEDKIQERVSACSSSSSEAMLLIKEVEMVDSLDNLKSSHSTHGYFNAKILRCWVRGSRLL